MVQKMNKTSNTALEKIGNASLDFTVGLRSVRAWMDYSFDISDEDTAKIAALEGTLTRLKEEAADVETSKDEIFAAVEKDVAGRMEDWLTLEGEAADAYVKRTADSDAESLKAVEDAYADTEAGENAEVTAEDVAYTKLFVQMLDTLFELKRVQAVCKQQIAQKSVYEDVVFERAKAETSRANFLDFMPTLDEACGGIVDCVRALDSKYLHGEFPLVMDITVSLGTLTPETPEECKEVLGKLDDSLKAAFGLAGKTRMYHVNDADKGINDWAYLEVEG